MSLTALHRDLRALFDAGIAAVDPRSAVLRALRDAGTPATPVHVLALGKAAPAMARGAVEHLASLGMRPAGGVVVAAAGPAAEATILPIVVGDHPVPGDGSARAADALGRAARAVGGGDECWVLVSGGASSLAAGPADGLPAGVLPALFEALLRSGAPIGTVNAIRKRFLRWGAGRLAAALRPARVRVLAISDVPGDRPDEIGSGPCSPDPLRAAEVRALIAGAGLAATLPRELARYLDACIHGVPPVETPKPGDPAFDAVSFSIVANNAIACDGVMAHARSMGWTPVRGEALSGDARGAGERIAGALLAPGPSRLVCLVHGGETTVPLGTAAGRGGRCQELALAAARVLHGHRGVALLAAGTDGRDGPTDAAGAIVDDTTWGRSVGKGAEPEHALARHDSYPALDAAGALLRTGPTGTNVMDLVIGLREADADLRGAAEAPDESPRR